MNESKASRDCLECERRVKTLLHESNDGNLTGNDVMGKTADINRDSLTAACNRFPKEIGKVQEPANRAIAIASAHVKKAKVERQGRRHSSRVT